MTVALQALEVYEVIELVKIDIDSQFFNANRNGITMLRH